MKKILFAAAAATALISTATWAAVIVDETGNGFVGKGDVQLVYGWNNKQLQDNADNVQFRLNSEIISEVSWECTNINNNNVQERAQVTTTTHEGLVTTVARDNSKGKNGSITGFNVSGSDGSITSSTATDGPPINSCPNNSSTFWLSSPAGDPVEIGGGVSGIEVSIDGTNWYPIG